MKRGLGFLVLAVLLSLAGPTWAEEASEFGRAARDRLVDPAQFEPGSREWMKAIDSVKYSRMTQGRRIDNCPHSFDVLHYNITIDIDFDIEFIYGDTKILSVSETENLSEIDLDFTVLTVDAVFLNGTPLTYDYIDPVLTIHLGQTYAVGDSFEVEVVYHGHPGNEGPSGFGGFYFAGNPKMAFQMGVGLWVDPPSMGKYWFPCWDWPCDKATAEYHITIPDDRVAVCNGVLVELVSHPPENTVTYVWSETHQIAPHVMSVAAREYTELVDPTYDWIHYWVYPYQAQSAVVHFQNVHIMMDGFVERYGPYPFSKFGYVAATKGDMEHQTCVTHLGALIGAHNVYDWLLAHELAHQWWGDCVSVNDWRDIWLSEGFATYSEAIFHEHAYGMGAYHNYIQTSIMNPVFASSENFPIYDPEYLWGTTVYEKGATVLHMLRHVVGDEDFFSSLVTYRQAHEYGNAVTPEFKQAVESVSGQDLDWFFEEWIYDVGWPVYEYAWIGSAGEDRHYVCLMIDQVQTNGPVFTMPVDVEITTVSGDTLVTLWVDEIHELFEIEIGAEPIGIELDSDNWILNAAYEVPYSGVAEETATSILLWAEPSLSNPNSQVTRIRYSVPIGQHVRMEIIDAAGQRVRSLVDRTVAAGPGGVIWDGRDRQDRLVPSGIYFCRMTAGSEDHVLRIAILK